MTRYSSASGADVLRLRNLVVNAQRAGGKEAVRVTLHPDGFDVTGRLRHDERTDRAGV
ncbi:MAG: hypothetical protein ACLUI3_08465 [Christensenellales bacterium]